ncbi:MAG TPA: hypothetical protein DIT13_04390 [Verrucomicrobiales bacterium]|nr:hypothetical protein [Verrucomicrobiales bacterium]
MFSTRKAVTGGFFECAFIIQGFAARMVLDIQTYDPGFVCDSAREYARHVTKRVLDSWDEGADLVLLPEFLWMGLEPHTPDEPEGSALERVARLFREELLPWLRAALARPGKAVVLGTCPCAVEGGIRNRAVIFHDGKETHQDKLHLTPWEKEFTPGGSVRLWEFGGLLVAVIICLDIEIPELAARLRGLGVDLILCPSATETILGVERVDRCASARAVELGCFVAVAHLTGRARSDLIDENVGRAAFYQPSQHVFRHTPRWIEGPVHDSGCHALRVTVDKEALKKMRRMRAETNPSLLGKDLAGLSRGIPVECAR